LHLQNDATKAGISKGDVVSLYTYSYGGVAQWYRTSVFGWRTFPVLRSTCIWRVTPVIWVI